MGEDSQKIRIDKWLWHARFFKSRALAAAAVESGIRVDGLRITKPSRSVQPGDVLTFSQARQVRVIRIKAIGARRGPAPEAQGLYEDLTPPPAERDKPGAIADPTPRYEKGGRPSKKDRRQLINSTRMRLD